MGPGSSAEGNEKAETGDGHNKDGHERKEGQTATGAMSIQDPSKRTADDACLNEGGKDIHGSGKVRCKGQSAGPSRSIPRLIVHKRPYGRHR